MGYIYVRLEITKDNPFGTKKKLLTKQYMVEIRTDDGDPVKGFKEEYKYTDLSAALELIAKFLRKYPHARFDIERSDWRHDCIKLGEFNQQAY